MYAYWYWKNGLAKALTAAAGEEISSESIVEPPDKKMGDFAFPCFDLAKKRGVSPKEIADELAGKISADEHDVQSVVAVGPYVNFTMKTGDAVYRVIRDIQHMGHGYGRVDQGGEKQFVVEYAQPNTHKEVHVGHLRNFVIGASVCRLLDYANWRVTPVSYFGDVGAHVAKCLWQLVRITNSELRITKEDVKKILDQIPNEKRNGNYLGEIYTEASGALEEDEELKSEVSSVHQKLEAKDPAWTELWRETRRWSFQEFSRIFEELGVQLDRQYLESEVVDRGQQMVDEMLASGAAKESEGAIVVDLSRVPGSRSAGEDKDLGVFLIRKSDGTSLYATKDIALAELKLKEYPETERSLVIVDHRQSLYFKQLFATLSMLELTPVPEFLGYEVVRLKEGAMSSRKGNIVTYQSLRDSVIEFARSEILKRHDNWSEGQVTDTAWKISMAGMKFSMLKIDHDKIFTFDMKEALSFDGATGPYCQYAATRFRSILKKAVDLGVVLKTGEELKPIFDHDSEKRLALALASLPVKVDLAARLLKPSIIATWCLETSQLMNEMYRDVPILESEESARRSRLELVSSALMTMELGLSLLGISLPDEM